MLTTSDARKVTFGQAYESSITCVILFSALLLLMNILKRVVIKRISIESMVRGYIQINAFFHVIVILQVESPSLFPKKGVGSLMHD